MSKQVYNKLVRDYIPDIIKENGACPVTEILGDNEFKAMLDKKLVEEVEEYLKDDNVEELADIMEVLLAILRFKNITTLEFGNVVKDKKDKKGGFERRIFLKEVITK